MFPKVAYDKMSVCVCVCLCMFVCTAGAYAYANLQPLLWCQPRLSSAPEMEKEMLAPDSQSVLFLGRTYNYSYVHSEATHYLVLISPSHILAS